MESKIFYRIANNETKQGLWYDYNGKFTGLIHDKYNFCTNHKLPMPYDERLIGWLSATDKLETLFLWFTREDIKSLEQFGYRLTIYEATDYKIYENHWVINQESSVIKIFIPIDSI